MSTYSDSKFRKATKEFICYDCKASIVKGTQYLSYKMGMKNTVCVCMKCSEKIDNGLGFPTPRFDCVDTRNLLKMKLR